MLRNIWKDIFSDGLMTVILNYFFRTSKQKEVEDLELFCYRFIEGTVEDRAELLMAILGVDNSITPRSFQNYVTDLIESYILILRKKHPDVYGSWITGDLTEKSDMAIVAKFFVSDINYTEGKIDLEELKKWMNRSGFVEFVLDKIIRYAFNLDVDVAIPVLPKADKSSTLLRVPTVLALSYLTRRTNRTKWRLLYSSSTDPHSWNIIQQSIDKQGPTLVLIQDNGGPLFGGYASTSWRVSPTFYGDEQCFLFRLRPEMMVCRSTGYNKNFQYLNSDTKTLPSGLGMGGQFNYFGLFLSSEFGPGSVSKTCTTFRDYTPLASQNEFSFSRIEIWAVDEPDRVETEQRSGLIMENDPQATAFLEMAGRTGFSTNLG